MQSKILVQIAKAITAHSGGISNPRIEFEIKAFEAHYPVDASWLEKTVLIKEQITKNVPTVKKTEITYQHGMWPWDEPIPVNRDTEDINGLYLSPSYPFISPVKGSIYSDPKEIRKLCLLMVPGTVKSILPVEDKWRKKQSVDPLIIGTPPKVFQGRYWGGVGL